MQVLLMQAQLLQYVLVLLVFSAGSVWILQGYLICSCTFNFPSLDGIRFYRH